MKKIIKYLFNKVGLNVTRIDKKSFAKISNRAIDKTNYNSNIVPIELRENAFEIQRFLTFSQVKDIVIFDIGAYDGMTALKYKNIFPNSKIYSFEPFEESFNKLQHNTSSIEGITGINKAVSDRVGSSVFYSNNFAPTNSILPTHQNSEKVWGSGLLESKESVQVNQTTVDSFVNENNIQNIDILKIDVQGAEYMVMKGAEETLRKKLVKLIYTEIITMPTYQGQLELEEVIILMKSYGYRLYNFYNYYLTKRGELRQVDAIFLQLPE